MSIVLTFTDSRPQAQRFAKELECECRLIDTHIFPDGETRITLPEKLPTTAILFRSLNDPNNKLIELLLASRTARQLGARTLILISPYLCYMRQDMAFHPGEAVSQQIIGHFLAELFDAVITVDAHLHRIRQLNEAIPLPHACNQSAAQLLGQHLLGQNRRAILLGPDEESRQWVQQVAEQSDYPFYVARKIRHNDQQVTITLPETDFRQRHVILVDDMISSGTTLAETARLLYQAGAEQVDALCTHALYDDTAEELLQKAGIGSIWSSDSVSHPSNSVQLAPLLATTVKTILE